MINSTQKLSGTAMVAMVTILLNIIQSDINVSYVNDPVSHNNIVYHN